VPTPSSPPEAQNGANAPAPGTAIQWSQQPPTSQPQASQSQAGASVTPSAGSSSPSPDVGRTIHWNDEGAAGANAPPPAATPSPQAATPAPLPPGTVVPGPPPAAALLGTVEPVAPDVRWKTAVQGDAVQVEVIDPASHYRVERIDLIAPDGQVLAAKEITRIAASTDAPYAYNRPEFGVAGFGGSGGSGVHLGVGMAFPLGSGPPSPTDPDRYATRTIAVMYVPDPVAYLRTADRWTVRVRLLDPAHVAYSVQFPAPIPPRS
jgi:hypothetical protein